MHVKSRLHNLHPDSSHPELCFLVWGLLVLFLSLLRLSERERLRERERVSERERESQRERERVSERERERDRERQREREREIYIYIYRERERERAPCFSDLTCVWGNALASTGMKDQVLNGFLSSWMRA